MRILFINRMLSMVRGGGETFDLEIGRHLATLGCEVTYLSGIPLFGAARLKDPFFAFNHPPGSVQVRSPYTAWLPWDKMRGGWRIRRFDFRCFEKRALDWVAKHQSEFDLIQICQLQHFAKDWHSRQIDLPLVMRLTGPHCGFEPGILTIPDALIASGTSVSFVRERERPDCENVPNSVDITHFQPQKSNFRQELGIPSDSPVLLYVARFQGFKNHQMLMDAFRKIMDELPEAHLLLVGSGHLESVVKKQCDLRKIRDHVHFLGEVNYDQLPDIYNAADIKVVTSDYESFCFAVLEAMACGLPVVSTDCGWVPVLMGGEQTPEDRSIIHEAQEVAGGIVCPRSKPSEFAAKVIDLWRDDEKLSLMGERNRTVVTRDHTWEKSAAKLHRIYNACLDPAGGNSGD